jgi:transcription-repair coupling factor (superfamily II helicase)
MPAVNTMLIHRADMFGLAQLYQLRGRVGRGKQRGYAYLTWPQSHRLSAAAQKRLEVMQTLDALGAGFTLASHDLDIRGAGNLLGDEQSGHIREVGIELYQQMLEEAVADLKAGQGRKRSEADHARDFTPNINLGLPVLIPEDYVKDLPVRLGLYRRIGALANEAEVEAMAAEMADRFGPLPAEVENLLQVVAIKALCRAAGVERLDAGPKGIVLSFHRNRFRNPGGLITWVGAQKGLVKLRPDHKLALLKEMDLAQRVRVAKELLGALAKVAEGKGTANPDAAPPRPKPPPPGTAAAGGGSGRVPPPRPPVPRAPRPGDPKPVADAVVRPPRPAAPPARPDAAGSTPSTPPRAAAPPRTPFRAGGFPPRGNTGRR